MKHAATEICGLIGEDDFDKWLYVQAPERETKLENNFEKEILNGLNIDSIYYINASSGSGKTTYLRHFASLLELIRNIWRII